MTPCQVQARPACLGLLAQPRRLLPHGRAHARRAALVQKSRVTGDHCRLPHRPLLEPRPTEDAAEIDREAYERLTREPTGFLAIRPNRHQTVRSA
jgi:hypothetical protein